MSAIEEYRRKLAEFAVEHITLLSDIADTEKRLDGLKRKVAESYGNIDDNLDLGEIKPDKPEQ